MIIQALCVITGWIAREIADATCEESDSEDRITFALLACLLVHAIVMALYTLMRFFQ